MRSAGSSRAAEEFEARVEQAAPALGDPVAGLYAAVGPDLRHGPDLDTRGVRGQYLETTRCQICDEGLSQ